MTRKSKPKIRWLPRYLKDSSQLKIMMDDSDVTIYPDSKEFYITADGTKNVKLVCDREQFKNTKNQRYSPTQIYCKVVPE